MSEIAKKTFVASFIFEVTVNDDKITQSGNDPEIQHYALALLHQFLKTDQEKVKRLIGQNIALTMSTWNTDDTEKVITGIVIDNGDEDKEDLFGSAINALPTIEHQWWQEVLDDPESSISECTESIVDCFSVNFVSSQLQEAIPVNIVDAIPAKQNNDNYDDDIDSGDDYWGPIVRIEDEDEIIMQRVSADEIFGKGFTKFLAEYREAEAQREAKQQ